MSRDTNTMQPATSPPRFYIDVDDNAPRAYYSRMHRVAVVVLLLLLVNFAALDALWCIEECERALETPTTTGNPVAAFARTCLYCPLSPVPGPAVTVWLPFPLAQYAIGRSSQTSPGFIRLLEHPPRS